MHHNGCFFFLGFICILFFFYLFSGSFVSFLLFFSGGSWDSRSSFTSTRIHPCVIAPPRSFQVPFPYPIGSLVDPAHLGPSDRPVLFLFLTVPHPFFFCDLHPTLATPSDFLMVSFFSFLGSSFFGFVVHFFPLGGHPVPSKSTGVSRFPL